jgi:hypothetical protein
VPRSDSLAALGNRFRLKSRGHGGQERSQLVAMGCRVVGCVGVRAGKVFRVFPFPDLLMICSKVHTIRPDPHSEFQKKDIEKFGTNI